MNLSTQPYKGTRDYYPEQKRVQNYIFGIWNKVAKSYGYQEYGAPLLEPLEVYTAKSGQELAGEQTYAFTDRGERTVAIRPEMTPTISRMVAARRQELGYPTKLYSIANFMRYERPQKGREREFWQLNVDVFGDDSLAAEVEIISMADAILKEFGAKSDDYVIRLNDRRLISQITSEYLGLNDESARAMIKLFDRKSKVSEADFEAQAVEILGSDGSFEKVKHLLDSSLDDLPAELADSESAGSLRQLVSRLNLPNVKFDLTLVRGLDYYTGTVFEVYDTNPDNSRSLFGGGRYDGLVGYFGVEPVSAVGMAPGATVLEDFLNTHQLIPKLGSTADLCVASVGGAEASGLVNQLRQLGLNVDYDSTERKIDQKIKSAVKKQINFVLFVGEQELSSQTYNLKDLTSGNEQKLNLQELANIFKRPIS